MRACMCFIGHCWSLGKNLLYSATWAEKQHFETAEYGRPLLICNGPEPMLEKAQNLPLNPAGQITGQKNPVQTKAAAGGRLKPLALWSLNAQVSTPYFPLVDIVPSLLSGFQLLWHRQVKEKNHSDYQLFPSSLRCYFQCFRVSRLQALTSKLPLVNYNASFLIQATLLLSRFKWEFHPECYPVCFLSRWSKCDTDGQIMNFRGKVRGNI